jgi:calcineurin-like phosphoesterase family protein
LTSVKFKLSHYPSAGSVTITHLIATEAQHFFAIRGHAHGPARFRFFE